MRLHRPFISAYALAALLTFGALQIARADGCTYGAPAPRVATAGVVYVSSTVARPNDGVDDTAALQAALDSLQPGQALVFDLPGVYEHSLRLHVRRPNVIVEGAQAILKGTNPADQAVMIEADDVEVRNLVINNVTDYRRTTPETAGISAYTGYVGWAQLHRLSILGNTIRGDGTTTTGGAPGTPTQASASGGIFLHNVDGFIVSGNTINRSLADGIHITQNSHNGRVLGNTIEDSGDDGIAVVSYLGTGWRTSAYSQPNWLTTANAAYLSTNIHIKGNTVRRGWWGRGISVIGADAVTVENNTVTDIARYAGLFIASDPGYNTVGNNNILVKNNQVSNIGKYLPTWLPTGSGFGYVSTNQATPNNSGHGGIEIAGKIIIIPDPDPAKDINDWKLLNAPSILPVRFIQVEGNTVQNTQWPAIRIGAASLHMGPIALMSNQFNNSWSGQVFTVNGSNQILEGGLYCYGNTSNGAGWLDAACSAVPATWATGFTCNAGQL